MIARRPDGYHELESLMLPIDLADELDLEVSEAGATQVDLVLDPPSEGVPGGDANLAVRAARAFLDAAGRSCRVRMRLAKRVPAAAGLGGGSSDAGAVLRGLATRFPDALPAGALERVALGLGADVPFFLEPLPARVAGIGERREPLAARLPSFPVLLVNPGVPLATAEVFRAYDDAQADRPAARRLAPDLAAVLAQPGPAALQTLLGNDLEPPARKLCPGLGPLREALEAAGASAVGLSGSGATLFGVFEAPEAAAAAGERLGRELPPQSWLRVARTAESLARTAESR